MCHLADAPQELINTTTGAVEKHTTQTLYGTRMWAGRCTSPLLFAGLYEDTESGWAYSRFRYYNPAFSAGNAQNPFGLAPRLASAQRYVDYTTHWVDALGLMTHKAAHGMPPSAPHPIYDGHRVNGEFMGQSSLIRDGMSLQSEYSETMSALGYETNRSLPNSNQRPDAYRINEDNFVTEVRELKPDTPTGRRAGAAQLQKYETIANQNNARVSEATGKPAPTVSSYADFYTVENGNFIFKLGK